VAASTSKAHTAECKRAAAAEAAVAAAHAAAAAAEAVVDSLGQQLEAARTQACAAEAAAADAAAAQQHLQQQLEAKQQHWQQQHLALQRQHTQEVQQLQERLQQQERQLLQHESALSEARSKAQAADSGLASIRSEVAEWMKLRKHATSTHARATASTGHAAAPPPRFAAAGNSNATPKGSTTRLQPGRPVKPAGAVAAGAGAQDAVPGLASNSSSNSKQSVPVVVARQLQQQAQDLIRSQHQVAHLQVRMGCTAAAALPRLHANRHLQLGTLLSHDHVHRQCNKVNSSTACSRPGWCITWVQTANDADGGLQADVNFACQGCNADLMLLLTLAVRLEVLTASSSSGSFLPA